MQFINIATSIFKLLIIFPPPENFKGWVNAQFT